MTEITINKDWDKIKTKIKRKYRDITDSELEFQPGMEEELITRLMALIGQDRSYVVFMLKKMQLNMDNNRL